MYFLRGVPQKEFDITKIKGARHPISNVVVPVHSWINDLRGTG